MMIADQIASLLLSDRFSDVVFCVGSANKLRFHGHKFIMSLASPVFDKMFHDNFSEKMAAEVEIKDVEPEAFKSVLSFIYTGKCLLESICQTCVVVYMANKYMLNDTSIYQKCVDYFTSNINSSDFYKIHKTIRSFSLTDKSIKCGPLMRKVWEVFSENADSLLQYNSFTELNAEEVKAFLCRDDLKISSEIVVFDALVTWAEKKCKKEKLLLTDDYKRKVIGQLIYVVRFTTMTWTEFQRGPASTNLLTEEEKSLILEDISSETSNWLSPGISKKQRSRNPAEIKREILLSYWFSEIETCNYGTLLIASSLDIIITGVELVPISQPELSKVDIEIAIVDGWDEVQWQKECEVYPPKTRKSNSGVFTTESDECCVHVGDVYLKAARLYKILVIVQNGSLHTGVGKSSGVDELRVNDQILRIAFKSFPRRNLSLEELRRDQDWAELNAKLCTTVPKGDSVGTVSSIIRRIHFLA